MKTNDVSDYSSQNFAESVKIKHRLVSSTETLTMIFDEYQKVVV